MRATFNASFVCSPSKARKDGQSPIELSISVNGKRTYIQLPKKCRAEDFDKLLQSRSDNDIKTYCNTIIARVNEIQTNLTINGEPITAKRIKDYFKYGATATSYTMEELFRDGIKLKLQSKSKIATIKKYQILPKIFYEYTGLTAENDAREVKNKDILNFITKAGNKYKQSSLNRLLKMLKFYFNYAFENGRIPSNPFAGIKIKKPQEEQVFLTYDEIKKIRDLKITNDKMDRVRDIFLFMCFSGLEYGDMEKLERGDVQKQGSQLYIKKRRIKTGGRENGEEYISVLYEDAIDIWEVYDGNLPLISNTKLNLYLKQLAKDAGIDKNITTLTARHTYATYLLSKKMLPEAVVQKMLGHTNSTQTRHYAKMLDNSVLEANLAVSNPQPKRTGKVSEYRDAQDDMEAFRALLGIE